MEITVNKQDLVALVKGREPSYALIEWATHTGLGHYTGGMADRWDYTHGFAEKFNEQELYQIYLRLKTGK